MATKQLKITLQAQPQGETDVTMVVSVNGTECFNQSVPALGPIVLNEPDPSESVQFDIDVPVLVANVDPTVTYPVTVSCTNGSVKIEGFRDNFVVGFSQIANARVAGNATTWSSFDNIVSQPLWNGQALLERYDISYNTGPNQVTGPGEILVLNGETVSFDLQINKYNNTVPLPPA